MGSLSGIRLMFVLAFLVCTITSTLQSSAAQADRSTPAQGQSDIGLDLAWPQDQLLDDLSGAGPVWWVKSMRIVDDEEGVGVYTEVVNTTDSYLSAPTLVVEFLTGGSSFGLDSIWPGVSVVPPQGSAYYQTSALYDGSIGFGDWDDQVVSLEANTFSDREIPWFQSVSIEGDKVTNTGDSPIGEIYFIEVVRDSQGTFVAYCIDGTGTGATIPPGKTITARGLDEPDARAGCATADPAIAMAESLGLDEYTSEYVLAGIQEPT